MDSNNEDEKSRLRYITVFQTKGRPNFTVTGGNGRPVVVKSVVPNSVADNQGLSIGSEIHRINGICLDGLLLSHVTALINSCSRLELLISEPSSETYYEWWDMEGRPVSPPPSSYLLRIEHPCFVNRWVFINTESELKANIRPLGLVIRGGAEYGLGIFISRVDPGSLAYTAGLQVGDQVLNVNGHDFRMISHASAVEILRSLRKMQLLVRFIGKLPQPVPFHQNSITPNSNSSSGTSPIPSNLRHVLNKIMRNARAVLDNYSVYQLNNVLEKYVSGSEGIDKLMMNLSKILKTNEEIHFRVMQLCKVLHRRSLHWHIMIQMVLYEEISNVIRKRDIDRFDNYLLRSEINKLRQSISTLDLKRGIGSSADIVKTNSSSGNTSRLFSPVPKGTHTFTNKEGMKFSNSCSDLVSVVSTKRNHMDRSPRYVKPRLVQYFIQDYEEPRAIVIEKCRPFLGLAIEGGKHSNSPLPRIVYIHPGGSAFLSGQLEVGYIILAVNSHYLEGLTHREAAQLIAKKYRDPEPNWIELLVSAPINSSPI